MIIQKSALAFCAVITLLLPLISDADADAFEFPGWEGFRYGIALTPRYTPMPVVEFIADGTPVTIHVAQ